MELWDADGQVVALSDGSDTGFSSTRQSYGPIELAATESTNSVSVHYQMTSEVSTVVLFVGSHLISDVGQNITLAPGTQTTISLKVTAEDTTYQNIYDVTLIRDMPTCLESQLSEWSEWGTCTIGCESAALVNRTRGGGQACLAITEQTKNVTCQSLSCDTTVTGDLQIVGASAEQMNTANDAGVYPFREAIQDSIAQAVGVSFGDVAITSIENEGSRRALSVKVGYRIRMVSSVFAHSAITALKEAVTDGELADTYIEEAKNRGEITQVNMVMLDIFQATDPIDPEPIDEAGDLAYWFTTAVHILVALGFGLLWALVLSDQCKETYQQEKDSQHLVVPVGKDIDALHRKQADLAGTTIQAATNSEEEGENVVRAQAHAIAMQCGCVALLHCTQAVFLSRAVQTSVHRI